MVMGFGYAKAILNSNLAPSCLIGIFPCLKPITLNEKYAEVDKTCRISSCFGCLIWSLLCYEARARFRVRVPIPVWYGGTTILKKLEYGYSGYIY